MIQTNVVAQKAMASMLTAVTSIVKVLLLNIQIINGRILTDLFGSCVVIFRIDWQSFNTLIWQFCVVCGCQYLS